MDTLNLVAQIAATIGAVVLIAVAPLEMFFVSRPGARRFLHMEFERVEDVEPWAFCIGARNLLAGIGVFVGLGLLWAGDGAVGSIVVLTVSWYMLLSSLAMGVADLLGKWRPRGGSVMGTISSSVPPLVVLIAAVF